MQDIRTGGITSPPLAAQAQSRRCGPDAHQCSYQEVWTQWPSHDFWHDAHGSLGGEQEAHLPCMTQRRAQGAINAIQACPAVPLGRVGYASASITPESF